MIIEVSGKGRKVKKLVLEPETNEEAAFLFQVHYQIRHAGGSANLQVLNKRGKVLSELELTLKGKKRRPK